MSGRHNKPDASGTLAHLDATLRSLKRVKISKENVVADSGYASADEDDNDEEEDEDQEMADDGQEGGKPGVEELLRYQDPIGDMQSGLHAAVQAQSREVAWLLLLLSSNLPLLEFPPEVFQ